MKVGGIVLGLIRSHSAFSQAKAISALTKDCSERKGIETGAGNEPMTSQSFGNDIKA